jgi:hypothetical protein
MSVKQMEAKHSSLEDPITNPLSPVPSMCGMLQEVTVFALTNLCNIALRLRLTQPSAVNCQSFGRIWHTASSAHDFSGKGVEISTECFPGRRTVLMFQKVLLL